jgi:glutamate/tyrosine decarboxylase-like PLP-dependent enzyme
MKQSPNSCSLLNTASEYAQAYLDTNRTADVFPSQEAIAGLKRFDEDFPSVQADPYEVLKMLHEVGSAGTVRYGSGRYFGFVNGGMVPGALAARWLADAWDQNGALFLMSPVVAKLEQVCEQWVRDIFKLPQSTACGFVSGSSAASIVALAAARDYLLLQKGWDVHSQGLFHAPELQVVVNEKAHSSIFKALAIIGLGRDRVCKVPTDESGRMTVAKMPRLDKHSLVICQAGEVNTGAFDPFSEIIEKAKDAEAWVHVDGAFGLWAAASKKTQYLYAGAENADSWSVDAHKTLNAPYDSGIVLCKSKEALTTAMRSAGAYLEQNGQRDGMFFTTEMSRRGRVIDLWAAFKLLGASGLEDLIDRLCDNAHLLSTLLAKERFHILNKVVFNQVLISCGSSEITKAVLAKAQASGVMWCSGTVWNGQPAIRMSVCDQSTDVSDIKIAAEILSQAKKSVEKELKNV